MAACILCFLALLTQPLHPLLSLMYHCIHLTRIKYLILNTRRRFNVNFLSDWYDTQIANLLWTCPAYASTSNIHEIVNQKESRVLNLICQQSVFSDFKGKLLSPSYLRKFKPQLKWAQLAEEVKVKFLNMMVFLIHIYFSSYTAFALCMISLEGLFRTVTHTSHYQWNRTGLAQDICLNKISS